MTYSVYWQAEAEEDLLALPVKTAKAIIAQVENYLAVDPGRLGKPLTGAFTGLYRYRMGDYRVIYEISARELRICVVRVGHRKNVYDD